MSDRKTMVLLLLIFLSSFAALIGMVYYFDENQKAIKGPEHFVLRAISPEGCKVYDVSGIRGNVTICK